MRLFDAILDANHRALAGDTTAGVHPADFANNLPVVALTCIDPRLNHLFPDVLGLPEDQFIWLRNAGNIIFDPLSSMTRTLALACAIKGGREIAVIGHTDCKVRQATVSTLIDRFKAIGVDRTKLPDNLNDFFGLFASEPQNVIRGVDIIRSSPLIGPTIPVHGLIVDVTTGKLDWIVNGYDILARGTTAPVAAQAPSLIEGAKDLAALAPFKFQELKFPEVKIGEIATGVKEMFTQPTSSVQPPPPPPQPTAPPPQSIPVPPRIPTRPTIRITRSR